MRRRTFSMACGLSPVAPVWAQPSSNATRLLVGATAGGGADVVARALAAAMEGGLNRAIVVENKPGAAGNIATGQVASARGNADTLLLAYTSHAINPSMFAKKSFDAEKDFTPIALIATSPLLLVGRADLPASNLPELIAYAKAHPGKLSMAAAGLGSASHLAGEMMRHKTKADIISVPYKGAPPALVDLLGGQIDLLFSSVSAVRPLLASGKLKALAISTMNADAEYPEVAPIAQVIPGFDFVAWYGLFAPAGLSDAVRTQLEAVAVKAIGSAELQQRLRNDGFTTVGRGSDAFGRFLSSEIRRWAEVVKLTGIPAA